MIIIILISLTFVGISLFLSSIQRKNSDDYMKDIQKELSNELKIIK
ncbi:hypothetical protein ACN077_05255 [Clostridium chromiireducens]